MAKSVPKELQNLSKGIEKLKDPLLLSKLVAEVQKEGIIGEEDTILALIMKIMLRKVKGAKPTSSNIVVSDLSGGGKDYLTSCVCKVMLRDDEYYHRNGLTPTIFTYWKAKAKNFTWDGKVIHIEDPTEELINCDGFKTMASGGTEKTVVKNQEAVDIKVEGKPVLIVTSLETSIARESIRRWDSCRVDTSKSITSNVMERSALIQAGLLKVDYDNELREAIQNICPKEVIIPFALDVVKLLPKTLAMRTQHHKLFDYICASAILHQHQREIDEEGRVIAELSDFDYAAFCFTKFKNIRGVPLNKDEEELIDLLSKEARPMKITDIISRISRNKDWLYGKIDRLKSIGILKQIWLWDNSANKEIMFLVAAENEFNSTNICLNLEKDLNSSCWSSAKDGGFIDGKKMTKSRRENTKKVGFLRFAENVREIDKNRAEYNLIPLFDIYLTFFQKYRKPNNNNNTSTNQQEKNDESRFSASNRQPKNLTGENGCRLKTENQTIKLAEKDDPSLNTNIMKLREFIAANINAGYSITMDLLSSKFDKEFIKNCLKNNIIYKINGNEYRCF